MCRAVSEAVSSRLTGSKPVPKLSAGRKDHAVVQLHARVQPQAATDQSASNVVSTLNFSDI